MRSRPRSRAASASGAIERLGTLRVDNSAFRHRRARCQNRTFAKACRRAELDARGFRTALQVALRRSGLRAARKELDAIAAAAWDAYADGRKAPHTRKAGAGLCRPGLRPFRRLARGARGDHAGRSARHDDPHGPSRILIVNGSSRSEHTCPGEMSKTWRLVELAARRSAASTVSRSRCSISAALASEYRPHDPSLQGLLLDRGAALPLALLLLPEPCPRPDPGLDERDLSAVGRGARHHDRHAGQLVPGDLAAEG